MACGLIEHDGTRREYARNSENSPIQMMHSYVARPISYSRENTSRGYN